MKQKKVTIINHTEFANFLKEKAGFKGQVSVKFNFKHETVGIWPDVSRTTYVDSIEITEE